MTRAQELRERMRNRKKAHASVAGSPYTPPRYDEVFYLGVAALDESPEPSELQAYPIHPKLGLGASRRWCAPLPPQKLTRFGRLLVRLGLKQPIITPPVYAATKAEALQRANEFLESRKS